MKPITWTVFLTALDDLRSGRIGVDEVRDLVTTIWTGEDTPIPDDTAESIHLIALTLEDDSLKGEDFVRIAEAVVNLGPLARSEAIVREILPIVIGAQRMAEILTKVRRGIISRTGFLSFLSSSRYGTLTRSWLAQADDDGIDNLVAHLFARDYGAIVKVLQLDQR